MPCVSPAGSKLDNLSFVPCLDRPVAAMDYGRLCAEEAELRKQGVYRGIGVATFVPGEVTKKLGRYEVPVFRLGRLAVSHSMQGRGLGGALLMTAGRRALAVAAQVGGVALAIDAKDSSAATWYERFGVIRLLDDPLRLVLPLSVIAHAIEATR